MATDLEFDFAPLQASAVSLSQGDRAPETLSNAHAEAELIRSAAHAEGLAAGRQDARDELAPAAAALGQGAQALLQETYATADRLETHAVDFAMFLAERIVGAAIAADPALVVEAVRGALRGLVDRERVTVLVHPDDLELVSAAMADVSAALGGIEHCEVQAERRVARGGAVVRTPDGDVDARLDTKLARAREVVDTALGVA
jgi:flagellar assembly protein FliH